jgi:hypothetical protein
VHKILRSAIARASVAVATLVIGVVGLSAPGASASSSIPIPTKIVNWVFTHNAQSLARAIFQAQGDTCLPTGILCYMQGSYDPPRWGNGTVQTGGSAYYLNARGWPSPSAAVIRTFPNAWRLVIFCQRQGPAVYGQWGWTTVWDYVGQYGDAPMFVSDGFVNTGTNGYVAGDCAATNYGG